MPDAVRHSRTRPWRRWLGRQTPAAERLTATTADGVELALHRVRPPGGDGPAVMLLHGLAANRFAFHFPGRSLASHLAQAGFDCYVPELRGAGESGTRDWRYDADDYLGSDLPALLARIREGSGKERLHWVGHSMGGLLLMAYGIRGGTAELASGLVIGAALDYAVGGSAFEAMLAARPVLQRIPVIPWGAFVHLLAPALGWFDNPLERFNFWPGTSEPHISRTLHANGFGRIPTSLLLSLASTFEPGGLHNRDGSLRYLEEPSRFTAPLRFFAGTRDVQCPVPTVRATARAFGERAEVLVFEGYGHFDLLLGSRAPVETWPAAVDWLRLHGG